MSRSEAYEFLGEYGYTIPGRRSLRIDDDDLERLIEDGAKNPPEPKTTKPVLGLGLVYWQAVAKRFGCDKRTACGVMLAAGGTIDNKSRAYVDRRDLRAWERKWMNLSLIDLVRVLYGLEGTDGQLYVVKCGNFGLVKLGVTSAPMKTRLTALQSGCPFELTTLVLAPGNREAEAALHCRFAKHKVRGEWFDLVESVKKWVELMTEHRRKTQRLLCVDP